MKTFMAKDPAHVSALKSVKERAKEADNILTTIPEKVKFYEQKAFEKYLSPKSEKDKEFDPDKWNWHLLDASKEGYLGDKIAEEIINNYKQDIDSQFKGTAAKRIKRGFLNSNYGVSKDMYETIFEQSGKRFRENELYKNKMKTAQQNLAEQLFSHQLEPLKVEHINDILKEIGADKYLVSAKDRKGIKRRAFLPDLLKLISQYDKEKGLTIDTEKLADTRFADYLKPDYQSKLGLKYDRPDPKPKKKAA